MEVDEARPTHIKLPARRKIPRLRITVIDITDGPNKNTKRIGGFAEVSLER